MMKLMPFAWPPATEIVMVGKFLFVLRSAGGADAARPERKISSVDLAAVEGQLRHALVVDHLADAGALRLHHRGIGDHRHRLSLRARR